jgi:hypothetical protein
VLDGELSLLVVAVVEGAQILAVAREAVGVVVYACSSVLSELAWHHQR